MFRRLTPLNLMVLLTLCLSLGLVGAPPAQAQAAANPSIISVFGKAGSLLVHEWVVVPPGADANAVAANALAAQGARRISSAQFTTEGLTWPQFTDASGNVDVFQNYNPASDPSGGGLTALQDSENTWSNAGSAFSFSFGGTTGRCPSLVRECQGAQYADGYNDVAWMAIGGCCTLGVTWFSTSAHEADMALNINFPWSTTGGTYDAETVFLHENGHVAGLGHSTDINAVMYPSYQGIRRSLAQDDINGIMSLYPPGSASTTGTISGTVVDAVTTAGIAGASVGADTGQATTTDGSGHYSLGNVPTGTRTVTASASGYASQSAGVSVNDGQNTTQNFLLTPTTGNISGVVTDASGSAIPSASVSTDTGQATTTNGSGNYSLSNVPTGTRTVTASAGGYASGTTTASVTGGQTTSGIDFVLSASAPAPRGAQYVSVASVSYSTHGGRNSDKHLDITVALEDDLGSPVAGASVSMELDKDTYLYSTATGTTGTDGTVTFTANNFPNGTYATTVTGVQAAGLTWSPDTTPTNSYP
jgi:hypothetical protein